MPRRYTRTLGNAFEKLLDAMQLVQAHYRPGRTRRRDIAELLQNRFEWSRATSYRYTALFIDKLLLDVVEGKEPRSTAPIPMRRVRT